MRLNASDEPNPLNRGMCGTPAGDAPRGERMPMQSAVVSNPMLSNTMLGGMPTLAGPGPQKAEMAEGCAARVGAFEDLAGIVAAYETRVFRFLLMSVRDRDLAETLTQETFLKAWNARESFRGECAPQTWLMRIAVNLVRDHTRTDRFRFWKKVAATAVDVSDVSGWLPREGCSAEAQMIRQEQVARIWETVATLSERQRVVFLLRFVEELELNEIAEATGMPVSTVKSHLYRAIGAVRTRSTEQTGSMGPAKETR
jgi:RNA polymerase sigma-70 factor (ECF subfamily)